MTIALRPYQTDAVDAVFREWESGHRATLLVAATGTGKTTMFAEVCRRWGHVAGSLGLGLRVLVIAHRGELIEQAARRIAAQTGLSVGIEMAAERTDRLFAPDVTVATVQSLSQPRRLVEFDPGAFGLVIVDEAHHATSDTYRVILEHFASARILGVTATPDRGDGEALRAVFSSVAYVYEIRDAIEQGYLCRITQQAVRIEGLDLSRCRTVAGDLNEGDLEAAFMGEAELLGVARATVDRAGSRPTMLFGVTVAHAHALAERLNALRPGAARALDGGTDRDVRRQTLREFSAGRFQYLANCALFTEGFDEPSIACVAVARPTKSRAFYTQMVGRGTRLCDGKANLLILDFQGNAGRHSLVSPLDILDGNKDAEAKKKAAAKMAADPELDILSALDAASHEIAEERRRAVLAAAQVAHSAREIDPFAMVSTFLGIAPAAGRWGGAAPAQEDLDYLAERAKGLKVDGLDAGQVRAIVEAVRGRYKQRLCSWNQARVLIRAGFDPDVSFDCASAAIDQLAGNRWRPTERLRAAFAARARHKAALAERETAPMLPPEAREALERRIADAAAAERQAFAALGARVAA